MRATIVGGLIMFAGFFLFLANLANMGIVGIFMIGFGGFLLARGIFDYF